METSVSPASKYFPTVCFILLTPWGGPGYQFVKLFFLQKLQYTPTVEQHTVICYSNHLLRFAVGPGQHCDACSHSLLSIGPGESGW